MWKPETVYIKLNQMKGIMYVYNNLLNN